MPQQKHELAVPTIYDSRGRIQLWMNDDGVGAEAHDAFKHWDLGDIVAAEGTLFKTKKGELSIRCNMVRLLTKSLRPLPDKFHGLADQEMRYRQRYVDLMSNESTRQTFIIRSKAIAAIRQFMMAPSSARGAPAKASTALAVDRKSVV